MRHHRFTDLAPGPGPVRRALTAVLQVAAALALVVLLVACASTALGGRGAGGPGETRPAADRSVRTDRVDGVEPPTARGEQTVPLARRACSAHGFDPATTASTAVVLTPGGEVRMVSFARGWDVFRGHRPGTLVAVCVGSNR